MRTFFAVIILVLSFGCSNVDTSSIKEKLAIGMAKTVATTLQCSQEDLIKEDILKLLGVIKLEKSGKNLEGDERSIYTDLCKMAVSQVLPTLLKAGVPSKYECKLELVDSTIETIGNTACSFIP